MEKTSRKLVIDCDPGIDDSMALLLLAGELRKCPDIELIGITIVYGNNANLSLMAQNARHVLDNVGLSGVPIYTGADRPLLRAYDGEVGKVWHGPEGIGNVTLDRRIEQEVFSPPCALDFLERSAQQYDGLNIITLGPQTNLALCILRRREVFTTRVRVISMGGCLNAVDPGGNVSPLAEANIYNDPEAANIVMGARWKEPYTLVPLDVTEKTRMPRAYLDGFRDIGNWAGTFIYKAVEWYYAQYQTCEATGSIPVHDSSAIMAFFHPDVYTYKEMDLTVVHGDSLQTRGMVYGKSRDLENPSRVALAVDATRFLDIYQKSIRSL